jgi:hypothetical protein
LWLTCTSKAVDIMPDCMHLAAQVLRKRPAHDAPPRIVRGPPLNLANTCRIQAPARTRFCSRGSSAYLQRPGKKLWNSDQQSIYPTAVAGVVLSLSTPCFAPTVYCSIPSTLLTNVLEPSFTCQPRPHPPCRPSFMDLQDRATCRTFLPIRDRPVIDRTAATSRTLQLLILSYTCKTPSGA